MHSASRPYADQVRSPRKAPGRWIEAPSSLDPSRRAWRLRIRFIRECVAPHWRTAYVLGLFIAPFLVGALMSAVFSGHPGADLLASAMSFLSLLGLLCCWPAFAFDQVSRLLLLRGRKYYRFRRCWNCGHEIGGPRIEACGECGEPRYLHLERPTGRA